MKDKVWHFFKNLLPHPKYWPKFIHKIRMNRYYSMEHGKHINFQSPKSFTEKMQWYMLNFQDPIAVEITDKIQFKNFVKKRIGDGYTAKLLGVWNNADTIDFSCLTPPYVLKSNCSGDGNNILIIKDNSFNESVVRETVSQWLDWKNTFINSSSNAFNKIKPLIMAEEYISDLSSQIIDYKFFCFDGQPFCAYTAYDNIVDGKKGISKYALYDLEWNVLDVKYDNNEICPVDQPPHLAEMIDLCKVLSKGFPFVRVDFYDLKDRLIVGELTYDSSWGLKKFVPESFDLLLGEQFHLTTGRTDF